MAADPHRQDDARAALHCARCGDAIGVYEPLVYVEGTDRPVRSSRLRLSAELRRASGAVSFFHAACHAAAVSEPRAADHPGRASTT